MTELIQRGDVLYWGTSEWSAQELMEAYAVARQGVQTAVEQKKTLGSQCTFEVGPKVDYACRIPH